MNELRQVGNEYQGVIIFIMITNTEIINNKRIAIYYPRSLLFNFDDLIIH